MNNISLKSLTEKLDKIEKRNTFFNRILTYLVSKYRSISIETNISDFFLKKDEFHSVLFSNGEKFIKFELHKDRVEIKLEHFDFIIFEESDIMNLIVSIFDANYEINIYKNKKGAIGVSEIKWFDPSLEKFNRKERISIFGNKYIIKESLDPISL